MVDDNEVNIKLELSKDKKTGKLGIKICFNKDASNVDLTKDSFSWYPTSAEKELLDEAFDLLSSKKVANDPPLKTSEEIVEKHVNGLSFNKDKSKNVEDKSENNSEEKEKIVEVGDDSIENAIEKHVKKDEPLKEADEHTIIDKVLNQKKKGKWKKLK